MDNPQERTYENGVDMGWLSCAIESEGSMSLSWGRVTKNTVQIIPRVMVSNIKLAYVENAQRISYKLGIGCHIESDKGNVEKKRTHCYRITWYGFKRVGKLLDIIMPYLKIKMDRALLIKEFINYRLSLPQNSRYGQKELDLFHAVRNLNGKGIKTPEQFKLYENKLSSETNTSNTLISEDRVHSILKDIESSAVSCNEPLPCKPC